MVDSYNHDRILSRKGLNTLMFDDPYSKLGYISSLIQSFDKVVYIDLDTALTAYLRAGLVKCNRMDLYLPSEGRFAPILKDVLAAVQASSLVVFDSVNSFYSVYYDYFSRQEQRAIGDLNHLLSVFLMLLLKQGISYSVPVLVTSMLRYRKAGGWKQSPASRRLLQQKSATRMNARQSEDSILVEIIQHETIPAGTVFSCRPTISRLQAGSQ